MSVVTCTECGDLIDSDFDAECFVGAYAVWCERCRDKKLPESESGNSTEDTGLRRLSPWRTSRIAQGWSRLHKDQIQVTREGAEVLQVSPLARSRQAGGVSVSFVRILAPDESERLNFFHWAIARIIEDTRDGKFGRTST